MPIYAIIYGGDSLESDISYVSEKKITKALLKDHIPFFEVELDHEGNFYYVGKHDRLKRGQFIKDKNAYYFKVGRKKHYFDVVLPIVHGSGVEDGTLGAYFDILKIPCIYSGILNASILQDKITFKKFLSLLRIPQVKYKKLNYRQFIDAGFDLSLTLKGLSSPYIIKPNRLGSSIGVSKAKNEKEVLKALENAFLYDKDVLIEEAVTSLKEVNIAVLGYEEELILSEVETVSQKEEVLSYYDKYLASKERVKRIIPADIDEEMKNQIEKMAIKTFKGFSCLGVVRFDFLIDMKNKKVYLNEVNTIPGSLAEHLFSSKGITIPCLIQEMYRYYIKKQKEEKRLFHQYHEGERKALFAKGE